MTRSCARDLTNRIKTAADDLAELLWRRERVDGHKPPWRDPPYIARRYEVRMDEVFKTNTTRVGESLATVQRKNPCAKLSRAPRWAGEDDPEVVETWCSSE